MNFKIENSGNFVVLTNLDTGKIEKKFNCPIEVDYYDNDCCGVPEPYFLINKNYQISAGHLAEINGISTLSASYKAELMNELMCGCDSDTVTVFEICKPYTIDIVGAKKMCFSDIVAELAANGVTTTAADIVGFDFDLKPINGEAVSGILATTSDATSAGAQGNRNLDGGGSHQIQPQRLPDNTFYRLGDQCFTVADGSVAVLSVSYI